MEHFEQLLTCCVCLDRYRNPKLLPCQHSFCMEPCMEGLVDYVRRQVSAISVMGCWFGKSCCLLVTNSYFCCN